LGENLTKTLSDFSAVVYFASDEVIEYLSETTTSQGVVAVLNLHQYKLSADTNFIIVTDNIADPGNLGTIIRTAYGFGVDAIIAHGGCDPWVRTILLGSVYHNLIFRSLALSSHRKL